MQYLKRSPSVVGDPVHEPRREEASLVWMGEHMAQNGFELWLPIPFKVVDQSLGGANEPFELLGNRTGGHWTVRPRSWRP